MKGPEWAVLELDAAEKHARDLFNQQQVASLVFEALLHPEARAGAIDRATPLNNNIRCTGLTPNKRRIRSSGFRRFGAV